MSIVRDECGERQARLEEMIDEFRKARARRANATIVKGGQPVELQPDADARAAVAVSAAPPRNPQ